jgi:hypothetical protein
MKLKAKIKIGSMVLYDVNLTVIEFYTIFIYFFSRRKISFF